MESPPAERLLPRRVPGRANALLLGIAGTLLAAIVISESLGWPYLKGPLQAAAQRATDAEVKLDGEFGVRFFWRPHLAVEHLTVSSPTYPSLDHLIDATAVDLHWNWLSVWQALRGQPVQLRALEVNTLDAQLVRDIEGRASWQIFGADEKADDVAQLPRFGELSVGRGHIRFTDAMLATHIDLDVQGGEGAEQGGYNATAVGLVRALPLDLKIKAGGALPLLRSTDGEDVESTLQVEGRAGRSKIRFVGKASSMLDAQRLAGELQFSGPSLAAVGEPLGLTLPRTPAFDLDAHLAHDAGVWKLAAHRFHIGSSRLAGDFVFDTTRTPGALSGALRGTRLLLADLGPAVGIDEVGTTAARKNGKRVLPTREFDLPSLREMNADVAVAIDVVDLGSEQVAPLRRLRTQLRLQDAKLQLQEMEAEVAGGRLWGSSGLDGSGEAALWNADLRFNAIDIARWLRGLKKDVTGDQDKAVAAAPQAKAYLTGELLGRLKVIGKGRSTAQILGSLDGQAQARLRNGTVSHLAVEAVGLDVAEALGVALSGDQALVLTCARVALDVEKGVFSTLRAVADTSDSVLVAAGTVNLNDEKLDLRLTARPKDFSPLTFRAPISITGTLAEPQVGIEASGLAGRAAAALVLGLVAPPAALLAFLDFGEAAPNDPCVNAMPVKKENSAKTPNAKPESRPPAESQMKVR
ncbi:MAG: AsmA family protein [Rubrivivax sp.]